MSDDKRYRECVAEITAVLQKYDMAGAITVVSKERAMFKYHFPRWSCIHFEGDNKVRFRAKREDFLTTEQHIEAVTLGTHVILQMRDIARQTSHMCKYLEAELRKKFDVDHKPYQDFDPEHEH